MGQRSTPILLNAFGLKIISNIGQSLSLTESGGQNPLTRILVIFSGLAVTDKRVYTEKVREMGTIL